ncbi:MAG: hypothetical protein MMC33_000451 [Icmadophila ericetorum]|nr:hypothetical protein [Icmadophila ericetorum]
MDTSVEDKPSKLSLPTRDEPDPRQSLQHVLSAPDLTPESSPQATRTSYKPLSPLRSAALKKATEMVADQPEDERSVHHDSYSIRASDINPSHTMTVAHSRRNANGTIGSVYSGNKIRHLKKEDGIPLWRKDIQFSFLRAVFEDKTPVFTAMDGEPGHNFADIYIQAMAKSNKTSKILREKLLADREAACNMAMICLLVNVGRMNTTLNFFPEMRAQLRTYHSIPCLQAHQDPNAYKQLQDAPRLKSILKGACEESDQPNTVEKIQDLPIPRTNPVNLIFVLSQYAPKISETHFTQPRDFFDLVIRSTLSSKSRAKAFLWLIWWYLESDFSKEAAENNPFGSGQYGETGGEMPVKVPQFEHLTEEQANAENVDTEEEKTYGEQKRLERKRILEEDETVGPPVKKSARLPNYGDAGIEERSSPARRAPVSDTDRTRSPSPSANLWMPKPRKLGPRSENNTTRQDFERQPPTGRLILKTRPDHSTESTSPAPPGFAHPVLHPNSTTNTQHRRARPETSHQRAVNKNRKMRIDNILHKKITATHTEVRRKKRENTSTYGYRAMTRIVNLPEDYDTEDENSWGPGGLVPNLNELEDYGGEALKHKSILERAVRRLSRDPQSSNALDGLTQSLQTRINRGRVEENGTIAMDRLGSQRTQVNEENSPRPTKTKASRKTNEAQADGLDDLDLDILGERHGEPGGDEMDEDSRSDGSDNGEDDTEEDAME